MKNIFFSLTLILFSLKSFSMSPEKNYENSIQMYNNLNKGSDLVKVLFRVSKKTSAEDKKFIEDLKYSIANVDLPKAKLMGNFISLDRNKIKIEIVNAAKGLFSINGSFFELNPDKSLKQTFKEIEIALGAKYSKYELLLMNKANAVGPLIAVMGVYGVGFVVTGAGCAMTATNFFSWKKIDDTESKEKAVGQCTKISLKWPYYAWYLYDQIENGREIKDGSCEKGGPKNKFGDLVKLNLNNDILLPILLKADSKNKFIGIYGDTYDSKNQTYNQVFEENEFNISYYIGDDKKKAIEFIEKLQKACAVGGTEALNKLINSDKTIRNGLTTLVKESNKVKSSEVGSSGVQNKKAPKDLTGN
jgi:hypothetical protein